MAVEAEGLLCRNEEKTIHILWKCAEMQTWRENFVKSNWQINNEATILTIYSGTSNYGHSN
jgi:hypothetical protein